MTRTIKISDSIIPHAQIFSKIDLFRNSLYSPKVVMLNLFQHLKEILKQVRDDSGVVAIISFERGPIYHCSVAKQIELWARIRLKKVEEKC